MVRSERPIHLVKLRNAIARQRHRAGGGEVLLARALLVQRPKVCKDGPPYLVLGVSVLYLWYRSTRAIFKGQTGDVIAALTVDAVMKARMIGLELYQSFGAAGMNRSSHAGARRNG